MKYDHPDITVTEPAPGYIVITGHKPKALFIENVGHLVPPDSCVIPAEIPADLLRAIADAREAGKKEGVKPAASVITAPAPHLIERIVNILSEGNIRTAELAERLGVDPEAIKAIDGQSEQFHIARGGWVKGGKKEGE